MITFEKNILASSGCATVVASDETCKVLYIHQVTDRILVCRSAHPQLYTEHVQRSVFVHRSRRNICDWAIEEGIWYAKPSRFGIPVSTVLESSLTSAVRVHVEVVLLEAGFRASHSVDSLTVDPLV